MSSVAQTSAITATINANYSGKQPNNTAYVKYFSPGDKSDLWTVKIYSYNGGKVNVITPVSNFYNNVYIPGNLFVDGNIISPSDINLKDNIVEISHDLSDNIMKLKPTQFTFKTDKNKQIHYGFIAQEFEEFFPDLVCSKPDKNDIVKGINYLEILPLLVGKIQKMQNEIDELKQQMQLLNNNKSNNE
jgi:hypothetical protein